MARVTPAERAKRSKRLAAAYKKGQSVRQLAEENAVSYGHVHLLLKEAGVTFRPRGGKPKAKATTRR